ncbi:rod shape-determining protein MreD [Streptococcus entericus]|uniref:rod shape-determining protein MreD n=1 Tax=Streptococcus entericus TaxID=155680 RepID=UPI00035CDC84|nr:rod shape-determining protein MreD [Streptococcus entericus]
MIKKRVLLWLIMLVTFFLDGQISFFLSGLTDFRWLVTSQFLLISIFYISILWRDLFSYLSLVLLGLFYDQHYLLTIGLATVLFPLVYFILSITRRYWLKGKWDRAFALVLLQVLFPVGLYWLGYFYQLTTVTFSEFFNRQMPGTILFNGVTLFFFFRYLEPVLFRGVDFRQISTEL